MVIRRINFSLFVFLLGVRTKNVTNYINNASKSSRYYNKILVASNKTPTQNNSNKTEHREQIKKQNMLIHKNGNNPFPQEPLHSFNRLPSGFISSEPILL